MTTMQSSKYQLQQDAQKQKILHHVLIFSSSSRGWQHVIDANLLLNRSKGPTRWWPELVDKMQTIFAKSNPDLVPTSMCCVNMNAAAVKTKSKHHSGNSFTLVIPL